MILQDMTYSSGDSEIVAQAEATGVRFDTFSVYRTFLGLSRQIYVILLRIFETSGSIHFYKGPIMLYH